VGKYKPITVFEEESSLYMVLEVPTGWLNDALEARLAKRRELAAIGEWIAWHYFPKYTKGVR
jgi:hypothetical protein